MHRLKNYKKKKFLLALGRRPNTPQMSRVSGTPSRQSDNGAPACRMTRLACECGVWAGDRRRWVGLWEGIAGMPKIMKNEE